METAELQIDDILNQVCEKNHLHAYVSKVGGYTTVLCCCKTFTEHIKEELTEALGEKYVRENFHFRTGYLEYV
ncbi:MAG TPA: hypothetical protein VIM89_12805 [Mucilaginibacter sp.]